MTSLRVLAYNLYLGGTDRVDAILAVLRHVDADVIALTEADDARVVATLAEGLGLHHIWERGSGDRHIATLSRFPIVESRIYNTPPLTNRSHCKCTSIIITLANFWRGMKLLAL